LLCSAIDRLLPTTQSRCQLVRFDLLPTAFVVERLGQIHPNLPREEVVWYGHSAHGSIGRAVEHVEAGLFAINQRIVEELTRLGSKRPDQLSKAVQDEAKGLNDFFNKADPDISDTEATRRSLKTVFQLAAEWFADVLRMKNGVEESLANYAIRGQLEQVARRMEHDAVIRSVLRLAQAERQLDLNANAQLTVDCLINDLARSAKPAAAQRLAG
jgi:hypothetical protein